MKKNETAFRSASVSQQFQDQYNLEHLTVGTFYKFKKYWVVCTDKIGRFELRHKNLGG